MKRLILAALLAAISIPVPAQSWRALEKKLSMRPEFSGSDAVVLLDSIGVRFKESGSGSFDIRQVIKIQTKEGALAHRVLKYDYDPLTALAVFEDIKVYKADGSVKSIDLKTVCDYAAPARAIYWGARQIMAEVGALDPGDIIDYRINKKGFTYALLAAMPDEDERFIPPMKGNFYDIVPFWVTYPTITKVYTLDVPRDKDVQYEFYQGECHSSTRVDGDRKLLTFSVSDAKPFKREPNMVDLYDVAPKLMLSSTDRWEDKSRWFSGVNEDYGSFVPTPEVEKKVREILKGVTDEGRKIWLVNHWVSDYMRYSGISMGEGEGYTLHNAKMNFTDRCGVCKDKASMLVTMLRAAGFEAHPAMTMAGSRIESIPADHFNHCVVVVKRSSGVYEPLDPTWVPFTRENWSSAEQQQNYLPGLPEGSPLLLTPVSAPENHYLRLAIKTVLDKDGNLTGEYTVTAEGQSDASVRSPFTKSYVANWQKAMENEILSIDPEAKMISVNYGKTPDYYLDAPIKITAKFSIPSYAVKTADGALLYKPVSGRLYNRVKTFLRVNTAIPEREFGFKDSCSRLVEANENVTVPKGMSLVSSTEGSASSEAADFSGNISGKGNTVSITTSISLKKRVYEAEDYPGFKKAVDGWKSIEENTIVIK